MYYDKFLSKFQKFNALCFFIFLELYFLRNYKKFILVTTLSFPLHSFVCWSSLKQTVIVVTAGRGGGYSHIQRHEEKRCYLCILFFLAHSDKGVFTEYQGEGEWLLRIRRLSPRYGVPLLPFAEPEVWSSSITHLLSPRYGVLLLPFAQPEVWSSSITICSARGMEFLYYHLLSPRYGVALLPFAQPEVWSCSINICSARGKEFLYYHSLSPSYGVPLLSFALPEVWGFSFIICPARGMEFLYNLLLSPRYGLWSSSITICSARGLEFLYYHLLSPRYGVLLLPFAQPEVRRSSIPLLSPRYGVPLLPFAQPEVWSSSITICFLCICNGEKQGQLNTSQYIMVQHEQKLQILNSFSTRWVWLSKKSFHATVHLRERIHEMFKRL